jgi:hypothetical protein
MLIVPLWYVQHVQRKPNPIGLDSKMAVKPKAGILCQNFLNWKPKNFSRNDQRPEIARTFDHFSLELQKLQDKSGSESLEMMNRKWILFDLGVVQTSWVENIIYLPSWKKYSIFLCTSIADETLDGERSMFESFLILWIYVDIICQAKRQMFAWYLRLAMNPTINPSYWR